MAAYEGLLAAAKGGEGEKRLAAGFITKFSRHFPTMADTTMDRLLDLIEDEDTKVQCTIRRGRQVDMRERYMYIHNINTLTLYIQYL